MDPTVQQSEMIYLLQQLYRNLFLVSSYRTIVVAVLVNKSSQMPRHLISGAHEWINEIPTVPIYYLANPQPRERAWHNQRGKKTLLSLTLVRLCELTLGV